MTMDLVNFRTTGMDGAPAGVALFRDLLAGGSRPGYRPEAGDTVSGGAEADKLLRLMDRHALERDGHSRSMGAAVALLKRAHEMIERAEDTIRAQDERIARLEGLAMTDEVTGLYNRRGFFDAFMRETGRCERDLCDGGLLVLAELDNYAMITNTYGHLAGESCLRLVARALDRDIRRMDVAARLGGGEFVLLLSHTSKECAAGRAQSLAWQLGRLSLIWRGEEIPVRVSLGLRPYTAGDRPEHIFNAADAMRTAAKEHADHGAVHG